MNSDQIHEFLLEDAAGGCNDSPSTGHQGHYTHTHAVSCVCAHHLYVTMLKEESACFFFPSISSLSAARTFCVWSLICKVAHRRPACLDCRSRRLHICLPTRRCVCIKVAFFFLFLPTALAKRGSCDFRMQMSERAARAGSFPGLFFFFFQMLVKSDQNQ